MRWCSQCFMNVYCCSWLVPACPYIAGDNLQLPALSTVSSCMVSHGLFSQPMSMMSYQIKRQNNNTALNSPIGLSPRRTNEWFLWLTYSLISILNIFLDEIIPVYFDCRRWFRSLSASSMLPRKQEDFIHLIWYLHTHVLFAFLLCKREQLESVLSLYISFTSKRFPCKNCSVFQCELCLFYFQHI